MSFHKRVRVKTGGVLPPVGYKNFSLERVICDVVDAPQPLIRSDSANGMRTEKSALWADCCITAARTGRLP